MFRELLKLFSHFKKRQCLLIILGILQHLFLAVIIFSISRLVDYLEQNLLDSFIRILFMCLVFAVITFFINILSSYFWRKTIYEGVKYLRSRMLKGMIRRNPQFFMENTTGNLVAKIMNDVIIVSQSASIGIPMLVINSARILIVIVALFYLSWMLTIAIVIFIPIYYLLFNLLNKGIRAASEQEREKFSDIQVNIQETLSAMETVKIHQKEDYVHQQSNDIMQKHLKKYDLLNRYQSMGAGLSSLFLIFLPLAIFFVGAYLVFNQQMSIGALMSYYAFLPFLTEPINNLSDFYLGTQTTLGMSERVMTYVRDDPVSEKMKPVKSISSISFSDVHFSYVPGQTETLSRFNLQLKTGDKVALLGKSGAGKSTLLKLIIRFLSPTAGNIRVNGIDLNEIDTGSYYQRIALLPQQPFLFRDTIKGNITFGNDYSEAQLQQAIEQANVTPLLKRLSAGLDYRIEEVGKNLSGGEQQRISLARALIRDADLLILDEPTSALDENNERQLVDHIGDHLKQHDCIFLVVTHRKEILNICNKAIFLKNGQAHFFDCDNVEQRNILHSWMEEK